MRDSSSLGERKMPPAGTMNESEQLFKVRPPLYLKFSILNRDSICSVRISDSHPGSPHPFSPKQLIHSREHDPPNPQAWFIFLRIHLRIKAALFYDNGVPSNTGAVEVIAVGLWRWLTFSVFMGGGKCCDTESHVAQANTEFAM